jgi:REP element-mobilizing transposase RayT
MARPLRLERAGGWYHLTARGNERQAIYRDERDRRHFCELLAEMTDRFRVVLHAYVLMENHYHLLVHLREANLSRALQWLNVSYSVWFNRRHGRCGHLFQGRFKSVWVSPEEWGLGLSRYLHLNPVRVGQWGLNKAQRQRRRAGAGPAPEARLVQERIAYLRQYRWSSYRAYIGLAAQPAWLACEEVLQLGGGKPGERRRRYRNDVEAAVREGLAESPWEALREQVVLGSQEFLRRGRAGPPASERESRAVARLALDRPGFAAIVAAVQRLKGEPWAEFRDRHGDHGRARVLYLGRKAGNLKLGELAAAAGMAGDASVAMALRRYAAQLSRDPAEQERLAQAAQLLNVRM